MYDRSLHGRQIVFSLFNTECCVKIPPSTAHDNVIGSQGRSQGGAKGAMPPPPGAEK